jgi:hypothetical protein
VVYGCANGMKWQYLLKRSMTARMSVLPCTRQQRLNEVNANVGPNSGGDGQRLEQPGRPQMVGLVPLASVAHLHELLHQTTHVGEIKISPEAVQRAVDALMAVVVDRG